MIAVEEDHRTFIRVGPPRWCASCDVGCNDTNCWLCGQPTGDCDRFDLFRGAAPFQCG